MCRVEGMAPTLRGAQEAASVVIGRSGRVLGLEAHAPMLRYLKSSASKCPCVQGRRSQVRSIGLQVLPVATHSPQVLLQHTSWQVHACLSHSPYSLVM